MLQKIFFISILWITFSCSKDDSSSPPLAEEPQVPINETKEMLTLGSIGLALTTREDANSFMANKGIDTKANWKLEWFQNDLDGPLEVGAMVVKHKTHKNTFAISGTRVSGSEFYIQNLIDLISYGEVAGQKVSRGYQNIMDNYLKLKDKSYDDKNQQVAMVDFFIDYIAKDPENRLPITIYATGASFAGTTASSMALIINQAILKKFTTLKTDDVLFKIFCFDSPSFFSQEYVDYFNSLPKISDKNSKAPSKFSFTLYRMSLDIASTNLMNKISDPLKDENIPSKLALKLELDALGALVEIAKQTAGTKFIAMKDGFMGSINTISSSKNTIPADAFGLSDTLRTPTDYFNYTSWNHDHRNIAGNIGGTCIDISSPSAAGSDCTTRNGDSGDQLVTIFTNEILNEDNW